MWTLGFLIPLSFAFTSADHDFFQQCPESVSPDNRCFCRSEGMSSHYLECEDINSTSSLRDSLREFAQGVRIDTITFRRVFLDCLPHDAFRGLDVNGIAFESSTLLSPSDTDLAMEGLKNPLERLRFAYCDGLSSWNWSAFRDHRRLTVLDIKKSHLRTIGDEGAFSRFPELFKLSLSRNGLTELKKSMLPDPARNLEYLYLDRNELSSLPEDFFTCMHKLKFLDLRFNKLVTLKRETFEPIWDQLERFEADGNDLVCDCGLKWILEKSREGHRSVTCDEPERFRGRQADELLPSDLECHSQSGVMSEDEPEMSPAMHYLRNRDQIVFKSETRGSDAAEVDDSTAQEEWGWNTPPPNFPTPQDLNDLF